jgi:integrase
MDPREDVMQFEPSPTTSGHVYVREGKRGRVWYRKGVVNGRAFKKALGPAWTGRGRPPAGHFTKRTAGDALRQYLVHAQMGEIDIAVSNGPAFGDACAEWLRYLTVDRQRKPSTLGRYQAVVDALVDEFGAKTPLSKISFERIESYRDKLLRERLSPRTVNKRLVILLGIWKRAQRKWGVRVNPVATVEKVPVKATGDFNILTPAQIVSLARAAEDEQMAAILLFAGFTGLRMGEIRALRWMDLDFSKRLILVRRNLPQGSKVEGTPKSGQIRSVPMVDQVIPAMDRLSKREWFTRPGDRVFVNNVGNPVDSWKLRKQFKKALANAGLKEIRFHDLRHSFATLAAGHWGPELLMGYLGHSDIRVTMAYYHFTSKASDANALSAGIASEIGPHIGPEAAVSSTEIATDNAR